MISSMLIGRLGNSLMQIAMSIGYARKYGYQWAVQTIPHNNESAIHKVFPNLPKTNEKGNRYQEHPSKICNQHGTHYDLCHFNYHDIPDIGDNVFFVGFWQSWKYFEHCKDEVKEVFKLPHVEGYEDYVSMHWRLGDYLQYSDSFPPVTVKYFEKAIEMFPINTKFIMMSDDINYCKNNLSHIKNIQYSEGRNELQDLSIMASCSSHIISNSTFSYWGAYLSHNKDSIVVSPSHKIGSWFGFKSGVRQDCIDLLPNSWHQIVVR